jgi:lipid-A-disaccharide synthase-like uncharacterized protein
MKEDMEEPKGLFGNIYEFTDQDLKSNQRGFITPGQKAWLESIARGVEKASRRSFPIGIVFSLFGICLILALFLQNGDTRALLFSGPGIFIALIAVILVVVMLLALGLFVATRQANYLQNAQLQSVQGAVSSHEDYSPNSGVTSYHLLIGQKRISFGDNPGSLFKEGKLYRVYYCKAGVYEMILSYEQLEH